MFLKKNVIEIDFCFLEVFTSSGKYFGIRRLINGFRRIEFIDGRSLD